MKRCFPQFRFKHSYKYFSSVHPLYFCMKQGCFLYSYFITQNTKKIHFNGWDLRKLKIFSVSSRTFLSEIASLVSLKVDDTVAYGTKKKKVEERHYLGLCSDYSRFTPCCRENVNVLSPAGNVLVWLRNSFAFTTPWKNLSNPQGPQTTLWEWVGLMIVEIQTL